jgi:hypothetical protein
MVGADAHHASHELLGGGIAHALGDHRQELLHGRQRIHFRDLQPVRGKLLGRLSAEVELRVEVPVGRRLAHPGPLGDGVHRRAFEDVFGEQ